jgi:hypothetical protein
VLVLSTLHPGSSGEDPPAGLIEIPSPRIARTPKAVTPQATTIDVGYCGAHLACWLRMTQRVAVRQPPGRSPQLQVFDSLAPVSHGSQLISTALLTLNVPAVQ